MQRQNSNVHGRERSPRNPRNEQQQTVENPAPPTQNENESVGPPLGGPTGSAQEFNISSNADAPREQAISMSPDDGSSEEGYEVAPPALRGIILRGLGQRHDYLVAKHIIVAHIPPDRSELADRTRNWSQYQDEVPIHVMRGPYWRRGSPIAYTRHGLNTMRVAALTPILDRFGLRKTPRTGRCDRKDHSGIDC